MPIGPSVTSLPNVNWSGTQTMQGIGGAAARAGGGGGFLGGLLGSPLIGPAALSLLPGLLSSVFGGESPEQKMRKQMLRLLTPQNFAKQQGQFYQQNIGSPAYAQGQRAIGQGANLASNQLQQNLAARGIGTSGQAALMGSLTPSLVGNQMAGLQSQAWQASQQQAQQMIQQQLQALQQGVGPSQTQQLFAGGLASFGPYLQQWMAQKYPGVYGTNSPGGGFGGRT